MYGVQRYVEWKKKQKRKFEERKRRKEEKKVKVGILEV